MKRISHQIFTKDKQVNLTIVINKCVIFFGLFLTTFSISGCLLSSTLEEIQASKTDEAKENVKSLGDGAKAFFDVKKEYPIALTPVFVGPENPEPMMKNPPDPSVFNESPWKDLRFTIKSPFFLHLFIYFRWETICC